MYKYINIEQLIFWGDNPRYGLTNEKHDTPEKAIKKLYSISERSFKNLATDISNIGLLPVDLPVVMKVKDNAYRVYEGNRRLSVIKSVFNPNLVKFDDSLYAFIKGLPIENFSKEVYCWIVDTVEEAYEIVERLHRGVNDGKGRVPWKPLEQSAFDHIKYNSSQDEDKKVKVKPKSNYAYTLITEYPSIFADILPKKVTASNANRILGFKKFKFEIDTDDYMNLSALQQELVRYSLEKANELSGKEGISRHFKTVDITENELIPLVKTERERLRKLKEAAKKIEENPDLIFREDQINIFQGNSFNLVNVVNNKNIFDKITFEPYEKPIIKFIDEFNVSGDNEPAMYIVQVTGYIRDKVISQKTLKISVKEVTHDQIKTKNDKIEFFVDDSGIEVDISYAIGLLIEQMKELSFEQYYMVITPAIRVLVEQSIKTLFMKKGWKLGTGELEVKIQKFKDEMLLRKNLLTYIDEELGMGYHALKNFIEIIEPDKLASKLNLMSHTAKQFMPTSDVVELVNSQLTRLLVIITLAIKSTII